ncbi:MAG: ABC transporter substrate-binding protein [Arhodomonas sp.]|nr:ABC transporter substrate-binding protein [Arhodomonas sp.]
MFARIITALMLLAVLAPAPAEEPQSPEDLVRETTREVRAVLEAHREEIADDPTLVYEYVADLVLPKFDFELMSRFVLGRHWNDASEAQRERFVREFRGLLIRTYGTSLAEYSGEEVNFPPMQSDPERGRVTVPTEVIQPDGPEIPVNYSLFRNDAGEWRVFDVTIEGVSLIQNYRSSFGTKVRREGLDALIEELAQRNRRSRECRGRRPSWMAPARVCSGLPRSLRQCSLLPAALPGSGDAVVDLSAVERADSAGLALVLEWVRAARAARTAGPFPGNARQLLAIARVSGVDAILPLEDNEPIPNP